MPGIEYIQDGERLLAILVPGDFEADGIHFFTPSNYSQQIAYMHHPAGKVIAAHIHKDVKREVLKTNEVLLIKKGRLRVDFYGEDHRYLFSRIIAAGDTLLLASGGHGFQILDQCEMIEVKQGPYAGDEDKTLIADHQGEIVGLKNAP